MSAASVLTDNDFTHDGTSYAITDLYAGSDGLLVQFDTDLTTASQSLTLYVDGTAFAFEDADVKSANGRHWRSSGLSWSEGDKVTVSLHPDPSTAAGKLVSNIGQRGDGTLELEVWDAAQAFTTGANEAGYALTDVSVELRSVDAPTRYAIGVWTSDEESDPAMDDDSLDEPHKRLGSLSCPALTATHSTSTHTCTTHGLDLAPDTTYLVVVDSSSSVRSRIWVTRSDAQDTGGAAGWSIGDRSVFRKRRSSTSAWRDYNHALKIGVNGRTKAHAEQSAPQAQRADVEASAPKQVVVTFDQALNAASLPPEAAFAVKIDGGPGPQVSSVAVDSDQPTQLKLGLAVALRAEDANVTVDYTTPDASPLESLAGLDVASFAGQQVTNNAPACPSGQPAGAFWTGCLTVANARPNAWGYIEIKGDLSPNGFTYNGEDNEVHTIALDWRRELTLAFRSDPRPDANRWVLQIGDQSYKLSARERFATSSNTYTWATTGPNWNDRHDGDKVSVSLRRGEALQTIAPGHPVASASPGDGEVVLTWSAPEYDGTITGWQVRYGAVDGATAQTDWGDWIDIADATATSHTITGLENGTFYGFEVRAMAGSASGDSSVTMLVAPMASRMLDTKLSSTVSEGTSDDSAEWDGFEGCAVTLAVEFLDDTANAVEMTGLLASDFTGTNAQIGTPVADADGLGWTAPMQAKTDFVGLMRASLAETALWSADEQVLRVASDGTCTVVARNALDALVLEGVDIDPAFDTATLAYTASVPHETGTATVAASAVYAGASVTIAPEDSDPNTEGRQVTLAEGETEVTVTVTPEHDDVEAKTWTVTVTREAGAGVLTGFVLVDASSDADVGALTSGATVTVSADGAYGMRADVEADADIGSVVLSLSGAKTVSRTESLAPWSLYGDRADGEDRVLNGASLPAGSYTLAATAYAERAGAGDVLGTLTVPFTVEEETAPVTPPPAEVLTGFVLLDASDQSTVATLSNNAAIDLEGRSGGSFAIRADVASDATVGSVVLSLSGAKTVSATESLAPYSLYGDHDDGNGGRALDGATLPAGTYTLSATAYAEGGGAGEALGTRSVSFEVLAPALLSVADARAEEGTDATLDFAVTLDRSSTGTVTVEYATSDGTATAGDDYTATSGTLTFAPGDREKTIAVPVLDDANDEGEETMTLRLSNASGANIVDGEATGTITNSDPIQKMWLARFGRTVGSQVVDAVAERLGSPLAGAQVTLGGQGVDLTRTEDGEALAQALVGVARIFGAESVEEDDAEERRPGAGAEWREAWGHARTGPETRSMSGRDVLLGSAFHLSRSGEDGGPGFAAWGRVTAGGFDAQEQHEKGAVDMDGEVTTGIVGADAAWARWLAGVAVSVSEGEGTYAYGDVGSGKLESTLTGVHPYARVEVNDRVQAWGLLGFGAGEMTMRPEGKDPIETDIDMRLGAVGAQGALMEAGETGGVDLVLKGDAFLVQMESAKAPNTEATSADASRFRLALEGSRTFALGESAALTPGLEVGLRHDGGDAETGTGVELGGRMAYANAASGLSVEASARTLIAHEDSGYEEWGASGSVRLDPGASGRGLSFTLAPTLGAASSGVERLWSLRDAQELANDDEFEPEGRLDAEVGYGVPVFGALTGTPYAGLGLSESGRDYRLGWRLSPGGTAFDFELGLEGTWAVPADDEGAPERGVMLQGTLRW